MRDHQPGRRGAHAQGTPAAVGGGRLVPRASRARAPGVGAVAAALVVVLATQYLYALAVPFINDDYVFLDKTRTAPFLSLWGFRALAFNWYRPWSRELHYWTLQRIFGERELPFHLASW